MPRTRIKICGITDVPTALAAVAAGADAIGLVFVAKSPRHIEAEQAKPIAAALPALVEPVGLFVDTPIDIVRETALQVGLRTVQLHGHEDLAYLQQLPGYRVIKKLPFRPDTIERDLRPLRTAGANLAALLLDTPPWSDTDLPGGSGAAFDWDALRALTADGLFDGLPPIVLAGGLTPDNVTDAVRLTRPYAVDVSSGVEAERGVKNIAKIVAFCAAVREADARGVVSS